MMQGSQSLTQMLKVQFIIDALIHGGHYWLHFVVVNLDGLKFDIIVKDDS
jgi:hypothetical protein